MAEDAEEEEGQNFGRPMRMSGVEDLGGAPSNLGFRRSV